MNQHNYFVYIVTNPERKVLYTGVTNNLLIRLQQHFENKGKPETFAGKYHCYNLIYWERFQFIQDAIEREKEIKDWNRKKKEELIAQFNPEWKFLNKEIQ
jgi:putative endonuclease